MSLQDLCDCLKIKNWGPWAVKCVPNTSNFQKYYNDIQANWNFFWPSWKKFLVTPRVVNWVLKTRVFSNIINLWSFLKLCEISWIKWKFNLFKFFFDMKFLILLNIPVPGPRILDKIDTRLPTLLIFYAIFIFLSLLRIASLSSSTSNFRVNFRKLKKIMLKSLIKD